jgi:4-amino-4-deoxy-L-arabinose transferase-like glycosyltransferase
MEAVPVVSSKATPLYNRTDMADGEARWTRMLGASSWRRLWLRVRAARFDDGRGLPPAGTAAERTGNALAWVAAGFILLVGCWEIDGPFGAGHYSASTAVAVAGENLWRWATWAPVPAYTSGPPGPSDYYCHHPFGVFWTAAAFAKLFGHHAWVVRLPAVLLSALLPRLLFGAGRALYGPLAGGLGALAYALLPITLAYANFTALEVPTMFGMALATYGYARFAQSERRRFAVCALLGLCYAAACDWPGFMFGALVLGGLFLRGFVLRRFVPIVRFERWATFWAFAVVLLGAVGVVHLALMVKLGQVDELLRQGEFRASGSDLPLSAVLEQRRYWILLAFTPLAIVLGKVAAPLLFVRLILGRRELELFPLAVLATAALQYVVFKQGADIHFFWPQYFALYFAYAVGALVATLDRWGTWALSGRQGSLRPSLMPWVARARFVPWVVSGTALLTLLAMLPDALRALVYARKSGGRFNEKGLIIHPDFDKGRALAAVAESLPADAAFGVASSMQPSYYFDWVLERPVRLLGLPRVGAAGVAAFAIDARFDTRGAVESLTREFAVRAYGPFLVADTQSLAAPVEGYAFVPRRLGRLERWLTATTHDTFDIAPDPFWTWELRSHLNQVPTPEPSVLPVTPEQLRVAHNVAVWNGDAARAQALRARLFHGVDTRAARAYTGGVAYLGSRLTPGESTRLTLYFETATPLPVDVQFRVVSFVEAAPPYSLVPKDELPWDVGMPFVIPTSLWRPGFVYCSITELTRRPGRERYEGSFRGQLAPTLPPGQRAAPLLTLE